MCFHDYFKLSLNNCCLCNCLSLWCHRCLLLNFFMLQTLWWPEVTVAGSHLLSASGVCVSQTSGVVVAEKSQLATACSGVCEGVSCCFPRLRVWLTGPWLVVAEILLRSGLPGPWMWVSSCALFRREFAVTTHSEDVSSMLWTRFRGGTPRS